MKIIYTGKPEALSPAENRKIEAKLGKLAKLLDAPKGEREAHVILAAERHLQRAEITIRLHDKELVGEAAAGDTFTAMTTAIEKIEKQILKFRTKWRDTKRSPLQEPEGAPAAEAPVRTREAKRTTAGGAGRAPAAPVVEPESDAEAEGPQVFRIDHHERRKPMTLDEAMIAIDGRDYVVYRDSDSDRVSVLIRRRDGNYDLIEA